jgi:hypothetical protein
MKIPKRVLWIGGALLGGAALGTIAYVASKPAAAAPGGAGTTGGCTGALVTGHRYSLQIFSPTAVPTGAAAALQAAFPTSVPGATNVVATVTAPNVVTVAFLYTGSGATLPTQAAGVTCTLSDLGTASAAGGSLPPGMTTQIPYIPPSTATLSPAAIAALHGVLPQSVAGRLSPIANAVSRDSQNLGALVNATSPASDPAIQALSQQMATVNLDVQAQLVALRAATQTSQIQMPSYALTGDIAQLTNLVNSASASSDPTTQNIGTQLAAIRDDLTAQVSAMNAVGQSP